MIIGEPDGATPLDPNELEGLKLDHVTTRGDLDELEQANVIDGLAWLERRRRRNILDDTFVRLLHEKLFGAVWDWAGAYRLTEKNIGVDPLEIAVQLRSLLDDARYWADNGVYAPLEAGARFHHRMVWIHPFANGNGRHARIAADVYLEDCFNHPRIDWAGGYDLQTGNERRTAYISALRAADAGDYGPLLAFVGADRTA